MNKLKWGVLALVVVMTLVFSACGAKTSETNSETTETAVAEDVVLEDYVDENGNVYKTTTEEELFAMVHEKVGGEDNRYKWEEPVFVQITTTYAKINNSTQLEGCAYHIGKKKFEPVENAVENVTHLYIDPMICTEKLGVSHPCVISQEKYDEIKESLKDIEDYSRVTFRGALYDAKRMSVGADTGEFAYECKLVVTDIQVQE